VTQALLNGVKAQGFNIVRIPITWIGHIGSAPNYQIASARLDRVAQVVDYAHNAGLKVIINTHHDDGCDEHGNPHPGAWLTLDSAVKSTNAKNQITAQFGKVWTQIAEHFKDYGDWLIFESMNEVQDGSWGWGAALRANPKAYLDVINELNQVFTDSVRNTGGNNAQRFLMYPSYASDPYYILPDGRVGGQYEEVGKFFKLPVDGADASRQIVTFHYYSPNDFALNGDSPNWGTAAEKTAVDNLFAKFKTHFINKNIPVIIGEIGPINQSSETGRNNRLAYITYVYGKAIDNGLIPVCWDDGGDFRILNRTNGQPIDSYRAQVIEAIMKAVGNK
jgi:endoglucanase